MFAKRDIKIGIIWRLIEVVGAEFFAFCSFLILTRLLAPEHFGVVALATILILVAQLVLFQGVGEALVQIEDIETSWFSSALWMNVGLATLAALVLITAAPAIAAAFSEPRFAPVLRAIAPLLLIYSVSGILQSKLRRDLKLKGFAFASILATILGAIVAAIMAIKGYEVWSLVGQQWTYALTSTSMFILHARWLPRLTIRKPHIERLAGFSFNTIAAALLRFALRQLDLLFLGLYLPSKQVGLYFLATRILNTVGQLTYYSIQRLGLPVLSRLQNDPVRQQAAIISTLRLTCLVCLPIFFGMAMTADLAIPIAFGVEWNGSIQSFRILCLFSIFYALSLIANQILLSAGSASTVFRLSVLNAVLFAAAGRSRRPPRHRRDGDCRWSCQCALPSRLFLRSPAKTPARPGPPRCRSPADMDGSHRHDRCRDRRSLYHASCPRSTFGARRLHPPRHAGLHRRHLAASARLCRRDLDHALWRAPAKSPLLTASCSMDISMEA